MDIILELQNKDEKGKELFLRLNYWMYFAGWIGVGSGAFSTILIIWTTYININYADGSEDLYDRIAPIGIGIMVIALVLFAVSLSLYVYYYVKTANHLGIKFHLRKSIRGIYKEMEQIAKEKKWI